MNINVRLLSKGAKLPVYQTDGSSGFDLAADLSDYEKFIDLPVTIPPQTVSLIPTGLVFETPGGYELQIRSRSGLAYKHQLFVLNSPGTVDADYRGEVKVLLFNAGTEPFEVSHGDRIAQGVICPIIRASLYVADELNDTSRGAAGFGSTGQN